ncbi:MAG: LicD family protein [Lachnospiraceae bacterium]
MESYQIKSLIKMVADGIEVLIRQGIISKKRKVALYGLDRYSFAMRTILSNLGFNKIEGYISDDEKLVLQHKSEIRNFACRFLNQETDLINVWSLEEWRISSDGSEMILVASKSCDIEKARLEAMGYEENVHFYIVCDFKDKALDTYLQGKRKMSIAEIKQTEKEMLGFVDKLCRSRGLRYWVCGGTLLGTIRHKGFIPWDDDIDIFLPWHDYLRFIEEFEETERFSMLGFGTAKVNDFPDLLSKVVDKRTVVNEDIGTLRKLNPLWMDVFPLIGLPDEDEERHLFFMRYKELNRQIWQEFYALNGKIEGFSGWFDKQREFLARYDFDKAACVGVLGTIYGERDCTSKQVYDRTLRMQFEDIEVNVPGGYQEYLDNLYGKDWLQLPDESKRKTHHNISVYWD